MRLVIQTTNLYTFNKRPRATLKAVDERSRIRQPDSIGIQEGGRPLRHGLKRVKGYKTLWKRIGNRHKKNNVILVRKNQRHKNIRKRFFPIVPGTGTKTTPERNALVAFYNKGPERIAHITTHFHVVPEEDLARMDEREYNRRARQYVEQVKFIRQLMLRYKRAGYIVFVTADGNTRPQSGAPEWKYSAYKYLARGTFTAVRNSLDFIIFDEELVRLVRSDVIKKEYLGSADHDSIRAEFEVRS